MHEAMRDIDWYSLDPTKLVTQVAALAQKTFENNEEYYLDQEYPK